MAKKEMSSGGMCAMCHCNPCKCHNKWCRILGGIIIAVLGLLMLWPRGWFTFEHSLGLVVLLFGLKLLGGCHGGKCH